MESGAASTAATAPPRKGRALTRDETLSGLSGLVEGLHGTIAMVTGPELECTPQEAQRIARAMMLTADAYGLDLARFTKPIAAGYLLNVIREVETPKVKAYLAKPRAQRGGKAHEPSAPRPTVFVPPAAAPTGGRADGTVGFSLAAEPLSSVGLGPG